jgi:hypothetical protein
LYGSRDEHEDKAAARRRAADVEDAQARKRPF